MERLNEVTADLAGAPRARYALEVLLRVLDAKLRDAQPGEHADIAYGPGTYARCTIPRGPQDGWDEPRPEVHRDGGLAIIHRPGEAVQARRAGGGPGFDMLYATYACVTAPWEAADPADDVGCPIAAEGFLARHSLLEEPLVHHYAALLADCLGLPVRREAKLVLTHDVDNNFAHVFRRRESLTLLRRDLRAPLAAARRAAGLARRLRPLRADPNDRFAEWAAWHRRWGSRPAYFAASSGLFQPGSDRRDVPYDVRHPEVAETLRRAAADGAEIGVHLSLRTRSSATQIRRERELLEEVVGSPVRSSRHHWWALGSPADETWARHVEAGLDLDCSLGFNDCAGFRRGICVPFRPFDRSTSRELPIEVLPTIAMDAAVFDGRPYEESLAELDRLRAAVAEVGGALVLDWHVHAANPDALPRAARGLLEFVDGAVEQGLVPRTPLELL